MRLQLDSGALKALFDHDPEIKLEISKGVLENFKQHAQLFLSVEVETHVAATAQKIKSSIDADLAVKLGLTPVQSYGKTTGYKVPAAILEPFIKDAREQLENTAALLIDRAVAKLDERLSQLEKMANNELVEERIVKRVADEYLKSRAAKLDAELDRVRKALGGKA